MRHGIAVLIQLNLVFHNTDPDSGVIHYEANSYAAYNLTRTGKILDMVRNKYGNHANTLVHEVLVQGHSKISDLVKAFQNRHNEQHGGTNGISQNGTSHNGHSNINGNGATNGTSDLEMGDEDEDVDLEAQAYDNLAQLIAAGILEPVTRIAYQSPQDLRSTVEQEFLANYPTGIRGSKQTSEFERSVRDKLREIQGESTRLKKKLEIEFMSELSSKRRKLTNGAVSSAFAGEKARSALLGEVSLTPKSDSPLKDNTANYPSLTLFFGSTTTSVQLSFAISNSSGMQKT